jgi:hypothetical protein
MYLISTSESNPEPVESTLHLKPSFSKIHATLFLLSLYNYSEIDDKIFLVNWFNISYIFSRAL